MHNWKRFLTLAMLTAAPMGLYANCPTPETWSGGVSGDWNNNLNWSPNTCIPGLSNTNTDIATFGNSGQLTVSLDTAGGINPGLSQLIFNSSQPYTLNSAAHFIQFNGADSLIQNLAGSPTLNTPIEVDNTTLTIQLSNPLETVTFLKGITEAAGSTSQIVVTGPGQMINTLSTGSNVAIAINGTFSVLEGTVININSLPQTGAVIGIRISTNAFTVNPAAIVQNTNTGQISGTAIGSAINAPSIVINGSLTNSNTGTIGTASIGSLMSAANITINGGVVINTNTGPVSGANSIGSTIRSNGNFIVNGGVLKNLTSGSVTGGGIGSLLFATNQFIINGGSVINNSILEAGQVVIEKAGTLAGTGNYRDSTGGTNAHVNNNGTFILGGPNPGGAGAHINIVGSYRQQPTGTLVANILNSTEFSRLNTTGPTGTVNLAGTLEVALSKGANFNLLSTFPIVQAQQGITGNFDNIVNLTKVLVPHVQRTGSQVLLSFTPGFPSNYPGGNVIPKILIAAMNNSNNKALFHLRELHRLLNTYQEEEPRNPSLELDKKKRDVPGRSTPFFASNDVSPSDPMFVSRPAQYASLDTASIMIVPQQRQQYVLRELTQPSSPPSYLGSVYLGPQGASGEAEGSSYWMAGAQAGSDYAFVETGVGTGATLSYEHTAGSGYKVNQAALNLYVNYAPPPFSFFSFNTILGGAYDWFDYDTKTGFSAAPVIGKGSPRGTDFNALFGIEYIIDHRHVDAFPEQFQICPQASIQYERTFVGKYHQHGAGLFDYNIGNLGVKSLRSTLSVAVFYQWIWDNFSLIPEVQIAWQREFLMKHTTMTVSPSDFAGFSTKIPVSGIGRNIAQGALDLTMLFFQKYGLDVNYSFEWNSTYITHNFYLNGIFKF